MKKKILIKTVVVAIISLLLSYTAVPALFDWGSVRSLRQREHFLVSDFYNRMTYKSSNKARHNNVLCIGTTSATRADLAALIDTLANPDILSVAAVGIDFYFTNPYNTLDDTLLVDALSRLGSKAVLPVVLDDNDSVVKMSFFDDDPRIVKSGINYGVVNLPGNFFTDVLRSYQPVFRLDKGTFNSFALAAIKAAGRPTARPTANDDKLLISYPFEQILQLDDTVFMRMARNEQQLPVLRELVGEAVIFIGEFNDLRDTYQTPVDELMPGVLVHAYAANTLIEGNEIRMTPKWVNVMLAIIIGFFVSFVLVWSSKLGSLAGAAFRLFTFLMIFVLLIAGFYIFIANPQHPLCIMFDDSLKMMAMPFFGVQIYGVGEWISVKIKAKREKKEQQK